MLNILLFPFGLKVTRRNAAEPVTEQQLYQHATAHGYSFEVTNNNGVFGWKAYAPGFRSASQPQPQPQQQPQQQHHHPRPHNNGGNHQRPDRKPKYTNGHHPN